MTSLDEVAVRDQCKAMRAEADAIQRDLNGKPYTYWEFCGRYIRTVNLRNNADRLENRFRATQKDSA